MKKSKFELSFEDNKKYMEKLSEMIEAEGKNLNLLTFESCTFGESLILMWDENKKIMENPDLSAGFKMIQSLYLHHAIAEQYQRFFDYADTVLGGEVAKIFFDEKILVKRTMH
jgi:hypothetical protein